MRPVMNHLSISAARTDALFVSALQRSDEPSAGQIRQSVAVAVHQFGSRGCAARVAQEFGEHPELAAERMRWAGRPSPGYSANRDGGSPASEPVSSPPGAPRKARNLPGRVGPIRVEDRFTWMAAGVNVARCSWPDAPLMRHDRLK